jgi:hypothetical protein
MKQIQRFFHDRENTKKAYVMVKVAEAIDLRYVRITQIIENLLQYVLANNIELTSNAVVSASWDVKEVASVPKKVVRVSSDQLRGRWFWL